MLIGFMLAGALCAQTPAATQAKAPAQVKSATVAPYKLLKFPPLKAVKIPDIATFTLPNGMRLYLLENHELPLVGGFALVRTGNLFEPAGKVGLAQITGDVMRTGGTKTKTGDEIDVELENRAASVESGIGETSGTVGFNTLKENTDQVLAIFKDVITSPEFRQDKVDLEISQLRGSIARRNDDASGVASREFERLLYGRDTPYGRQVEYSDLDNIKREDLVAFHKRYFFPANIMVAVQGDFNTAEMHAKLEKLFADWKVTESPVPPFPAVTAKPAPGIYFAPKTDVTQTFFDIGHLGGTYKDKDYPALEVMSDILGGSFGSRLFNRVRTQLGYAYGVGSSWDANFEHRGEFRIGASTKSASTVDAIKVIREEVEKIRTTEVTEQELRSAKDKILNGFVFRFDSPAKTLNRLVTYEYHGYPKDFLFQYQKGIDSVTRADVLRVTKEHVQPSDFTIVAVGNPKELGTPLTTLGEVKQLDLTIPEPKKAPAKASPATLEKGHALLQKMQQAMGGADTLAAVKDMTQSAEVNMDMGGGAMKASQNNMWIAPSTFRQEQQLPFGKVIAYSDGTTGWLQTPQGNMPMPAPVLQQVRGELFRLWIPLALSDRDPDRTVNYAGDGVLEISGKQGVSIRLKVDEASGIPISVSYSSSQMSGAPEIVEETFSDWRDVQGVRLPFKTVIMQGGRKFAESTVQSIRINAGLKPEELSRKP